MLISQQVLHPLFLFTKNKNTLLRIRSSVTKEKVIRAVKGTNCTCGLFYGVTNKELAQYDQI